MMRLESSSSDADSSSDVESDSETSDVDESIDDRQFIQNLVTHAKKLSPESFTKFIASLPISKAVKRQANAADTNDHSVKKHKKQTKKNADPTPLACEECGGMFIDKVSLAKHQVACKKEKETPKKKTPSQANSIWKCEVCEKVLSNKCNLARHVRTQHEQCSAKEPQKKQSKSQTYKCDLCKNERVDIYKHYGFDHNIDYPEQILFDIGTVLTISDINTDGGKAPWFIKQRDKANERYKEGVCRLCEVDFNETALLKKHYTKDHSVDPDFLDKLKRLFRAEKGSHLSETAEDPARANNQKRVPEKKIYVSETKKKVDVKKTPQKRNISLIMYKCKCGIATGSYDASVEHSQLHLVSELEQEKETCNICKFTFVASSFADHASRHRGDDANIVFKVIEYDFDKLLTEAWFDMFHDLAESHAEKIVSSSLYLHSRSVKIHSENLDCGTGALSYRCGMCELFVDPAKIENHCKNYDTCIKNKPKGHYCSECDAHFYSANALAVHNDNHGEGFRIVTFNNKNDMQFNKTLHNSRSAESSQDSQESDSEEDREITENPKRQENTKRVEIISDKVTQFCRQCKQFVAVSDFEAHSATHQSAKERYSFGITSESEKVVQSTQRMAEGNQNECPTGESTKQDMQATDDVNKRVQTKNGEKTVENGIRMNIDVEGTVELWDSDSDDDILGHSVSVVHAEINMSVIENERNDAEDGLNNDTEPELLLREIYGANDSLASAIEDNAGLTSTQDLADILENDGTGNKRQENAKVISQDIFSDDLTQNEDGRLVENTTSNKEREAINEELQDTFEKIQMESSRDDRCSNDSRMSSRDIIRGMIQDDDACDSGDESEMSQFLKLNALIAKKIFSRD